MIRTQFLHRDIDDNSNLAIEVPDLLMYIQQRLHPAFRVAIRHNNKLKALLYRGIQNGILFRNAQDKAFRNYWSPLSNAGLAAVPRSSLFHESTFFMHDLLHHNFPDLIIDKKDAFSRKVYIMHRVVGEAVTLVLADAFAMDSACLTGLAAGERISPYIFPSFKKKYPYISSDMKQLADALEATCRYAVLGKFAADETLHPFQNAFKVVYEGDLKWTAHNYDNFKCNPRWEKIISRHLDEGLAIDTLSAFIKRNALTPNMNDEELLLAISKPFMDIIFDTQNTQEPDYQLSVQNATKLFKLFNVKGLMEADPSYTEQEFEKDYRQLSLQEFFEKSKNKNPDYQISGGIFKLFDNMYVTYDPQKQEPFTLEQISERVLNATDQEIRFKNLIVSLGGKIVRSHIVKEPGVGLLNITKTALPKEVSNILHLDKQNADIDMNARVTYMSTQEPIGQKVYTQYGHKSVANGATASFVVAGLSMGSLLEFCSSSAHMNRMNTDNCSVLKHSLYTVLDDSEIPFVEKFCTQMRKQWLDKGHNNLELMNRYNLKSQAMACTVSFSIADWDWFLNKRINDKEKYEQEFAEILCKIYNLLKKSEYRDYIQTNPIFEKMNAERLKLSPEQIQKQSIALKRIARQGVLRGLDAQRELGNN